jgi:hypothetical protein
MLNTHAYKLSDIIVKLHDGQEFNIKGLVSEFSIYESIDSPAVRCEFLMTDANDFINVLRGNENIQLLLTSESTNQSYSLNHHIYKIGSNFKNERMQQYILHTVSIEAINNDRVKVFKTFKGTASSTVKEIVKKNLGSSKKLFIEETKGTFPFISPSWRPYDAISYLTDKAVRTQSKNASVPQSAFLFFENRDGIHFESIDGLIEKAKQGTTKTAAKAGVSSKLLKFTYAQKNVATSGSSDSYYTIESIAYPDKFDIITSMRSGSLGTSLIGIDPLSPNESQLPKSSATANNTEKEAKGPGGGDYNIQAKSADKIWAAFSTVGGTNPYPGENANITGNGQRKRLKFFSDTSFDAASGTTNTPNLQQSNIAKGNPQTSSSSIATGSTNKGGQGQQKQNIIDSALYSLLRYQALQYVKLNITVAGNVAVTVGDVIEVELPAARQREKNLPQDKTFSGYYFVMGVVHIWRPEGVTTSLLISRDSLK